MKKATATIILPPSHGNIIVRPDGKDYLLLMQDENMILHRVGYVPQKSIGRKILVDLSDNGEYLGRLSPDLERGWFVRVLKFKHPDFPLYVNKLFLKFEERKKHTLIDNE